MKVLLVLPPFAVSSTPSIGLSTLKSVLIENGIECKILYANLYLDEEISCLNYQNASTLCQRICTSTVSYLMGEFIFAKDAFYYDDNFLEKYRKLIKDKVINTSSEDKKLNYNDFEEVIKLIPGYLNRITDIIVNEKPNIVGFSSTFQQTCAAIAIANKIKERSDIITILGGFNSTEPMGSAILDIAPSIDYAFSGEAEVELLKFCQNYIKNIIPKIKIINCDPISDLNTLPFPDYSDYFNQRSKLNFKKNNENQIDGTFVSFESSRGCWWGSNSQCLFCGLNGCSLTYRRKESKRIVNEIKHLSETYKIDNIHATDNIIPKQLPKKLFEEFHRSDKKYNLFYEVRPTMSFEDLCYLKLVGLESCQPGIESLNDNILDKMNKKLLAINNIRFLRDCRTLKIHPSWNFLYAIPGEDEKDYIEMMEFLPYITHLDPPTGLSPLRIERYSLLYEKHHEYNLNNLRPYKIYSQLFPINTKIDDIALAFDADYKQTFENFSLRDKFFKMVKKWKDEWKLKQDAIPSLVSIKISEDHYLVDDTREIENSKVEILNDKHNEILNYLQKPKPRNKVTLLIETKNLENEFNDLIKLKF